MSKWVSTLALAVALVGCEPQVVKGTNRGELHVSIEGDSQAPALDLSYDVGAVQVGSQRQLTVRATNVGVDPLRVLGVSLGAQGNGSWFVRDATGTLAPGASLTATVTFAPVGPGAQATQVTVAHDADAALPSAHLTGTGT
jgi:hypothetical protein